jgi:hypothetical protein
MELYDTKVRAGEGSMTPADLERHQIGFFVVAVALGAVDGWCPYRSLVAGSLHNVPNNHNQRSVNRPIVFQSDIADLRYTEGPLLIVLNNPSPILS